MPSHRGDALRHRLQHVDRGGAARGREIEADAADARRIEPLELVIGDARIDDGDAARGGAAFGERLDETVIKDAVGRGLHDHVARGADPLLQQPIVCDRGVARAAASSWIDLEAR